MEEWDNDPGKEEGQTSTAQSSAESKRDRFYVSIQHAFFLILVEKRSDEESQLVSNHGLVLQLRQDGKFERIGCFSASDEIEEMQMCGAEKGSLTLIQEYGIVQTVEIV